jgi:hypothetical protein
MHRSKTARASTSTKNSGTIIEDLGLPNAAHRFDAIEGIKAGLTSMDAGDGEEAGLVFERMERKHPFLKSP